MSPAPKIRAAMLAAAITVLSLVPAATATANSVPAQPTTASAVEVSTSAERLLVSGWRMYVDHYYSAQSCRNDKARLDAAYKGYWIGGWADSRCRRWQVPACGTPQYKWAIDVKEYYSPNGPFAVNPNTPLSAPVVAAAC